jgi:hypothetical protein
MIGETGPGKFRKIGKIPIIIVMALSFSVCALPLKKEITNWKPDGPSEVYNGENLYLYMDGGASIYQEYGFIRLLVQNYRSPNALSLTLEIYEMISPAAAYGIYTFKRSSQGSIVSLGQEGCQEDYYLNFWKGHFLITMTCSDIGQEAVDGLLVIGKAVDTKIREAGSKPKLAESLPREGLLAFSAQYYKGYLGLFNSYPFSNRDIFNFREGIRGNYRAGYSVYILKYENAHDCQKNYVAARDLLMKEPRYKNFRQIENGGLTFRDTAGAHMTVGVFKQYIVIVIDQTSSTRATDTLRMAFRGLSETVD